MPATARTRPSGRAETAGLLAATRWDAPLLTYGFPASARAYGPAYGSGEPASGFVPLGAEQQAAVRAVLGMYAAVSGLRFAEAAEGADLRYAQSRLPNTAWAYYPQEQPEGGDGWFGTARGYYVAPRPGNYAFHTFLHEIGHALGLKHGHEAGGFGALPAARDSMEFSVMTYRSHAGAAMLGYTNERWGYAQTPMMEDIAALQHLYGANYATRAGDTVYRWDPLTGELSLNGVGQGAPGGNRLFMTVWDGGGRDTYDFSAYDGGVTIDLRPGEWSLAAAGQLARLGAGRVARGNVANALLHAGDERSLIEDATGGAGDDTLYGNAAANLLDGGAGTDTAVLAGGRADYVFAGSAALFLARGHGAVDTLRGIERVRFLGTGEEVAAAALLPPDDFRDSLADVAAPLGRFVPGLSRAGRIDVAGDVDIFAVSLRAGQGYVFTPTGGLAAPWLELRDVTGALLGAGGTGGLAHTARADGTYYLHLSGTAGATGAYTLRSGFQDTLADSLADGTAPRGLLTAGLSRYGRVETPGDTDLFSVTLRAGQGYTFDLRGAASGAGTLADPLLELRDAAGVLLARNDDGATADAHLAFTPARGGVYHLVARADGAGTGSYLLRSGFHDTLADSPADGTAPLGSLAVGLSRAGRVETAGDVDVFAITLTAGRGYDFSLRGAASGAGTLADPRLELRGADFGLLARDAGGADAHLAATARHSGLHYLVAAAEGAGTGSYLLAAARAAPQAQAWQADPHTGPDPHADPLWG